MCGRVWTRGGSGVALGCGKMGCCCFVAVGRGGRGVVGGAGGVAGCVEGSDDARSLYLILADEAGPGFVFDRMLDPFWTGFYGA